MMGGARPVASLGPTLLARKGGARPAMRPQLALPSVPDAEDFSDMDDLGWNDMGLPNDGLALDDAAQNAVPEAPESAGESVVRQQLRAIASQLDQPAIARQPAPVAKATAVNIKRKAAFTLRMDAERHLKLRLACTVQNRSAQVLLTDLIDRYLADTPDIEALAAQVNRT